MNPTKRYIAALFILLLISAIPFSSAAAQATSAPPQVQKALDLFGQYLGHTVNLLDLDNWSFTQALYTDRSLGCPLIPLADSFAVPTSAYAVQLVYQGSTYEFRVREDLSEAFPCTASLMGFATPGAPTGVGVFPTPAFVTNCPPGYEGYLRPHLVVGGQGSIGVDGTANRLRDRPARDAAQIGLIQPGTTVDILDGPSCEDASKIVWWRVNDHGNIGWTAEGIGDNYFLAPVAGGPLNLPTERPQITADTFELVMPLTTVAFPNGGAVSFSNTGLVAVGGQNGLLIYDLNTLQQLDLNINIQPDVLHVAFSPDSHYLAFSTLDDHLFIVDTTTGVTITPANPPNTEIHALAFSVNNLLAVGGGSIFGDPAKPNAWYIYDIPNQRQLAVQPTASFVTAAAFSPDGSMFAWTDRSLNIINVADGSAVLTQPIAAPASGGLAWRPGLAPGVPNQIAYPDGNHMLLLTLGGQGQSFGNAVAFFPSVVHFSPDGAAIAGMNLQADGGVTPTVVNAYNVATGAVLYGTGFDVGKDFDFSPDGTLIVLVEADQVQFLGVDADTLAVG